MKIDEVHGETINTRTPLQIMTFDYIELDYNQIRLHSTPGYVSPGQFEQAAVRKRAVRRCWAREDGKRSPMPCAV